jgi:hypothetical protein
LNLWIVIRMVAIAMTPAGGQPGRSSNLPRNMQERKELRLEPLLLVVLSGGGGCLKNRRIDESAGYSHHLSRIQRLVHKVIHRRWGMKSFMPASQIIRFPWEIKFLLMRLSRVCVTTAVTRRSKSPSCWHGPFDGRWRGTFLPEAP